MQSAACNLLKLKLLAPKVGACVRAVSFMGACIEEMEALPYRKELSRVNSRSDKHARFTTGGTLQRRARSKQ